MLQIVDAQWKDHLYSLDHLKEGIGLRGYGQRDPLVEYKKESFALFQAMKDRFDEEMVKYLWRIQPVMAGEEPPAVRQPVRRPPQDHVERRRRRVLDDGWPSVSGCGGRLRSPASCADRRR